MSIVRRQQSQQSVQLLGTSCRQATAAAEAQPAMHPFVRERGNAPGRPVLVARESRLQQTACALCLSAGPLGRKWALGGLGHAHSRLGGLARGGRQQRLITRAW